MLSSRKIRIVTFAVSICFVLSLLYANRRSLQLLIHKASNAAQNYEMLLKQTYSTSVAPKHGISNSVTPVHGSSKFVTSMSISSKSVKRKYGFNPSVTSVHKSTNTAAPIKKEPPIISVTRMVHQSWKTRDLPTNRSKRWSNSWKTCFPDWQWRLWTDEDNLALVRDHYPLFLPVYMSFKNSIERADLARYFYMFHYGGIYTDLDNVCLKNFEHLLNSTSLIFGGMDGLNDSDPILHTYVQNSFMASIPRHPFWMRLLSRVMLYRHIGKSGRPELTTGPHVPMDELREYVKGMSKPDVIMYKGKYFNPFSWYVNKIPACKDLGRMTDADEKACIAAFPDAYVLQFHTQSWLNGHL